MPNKPITYLTADEWVARVHEAAGMASDLMPTMVQACGGPGPAALTALLLARSLCMATGIPDFEWYCKRVAELPKPPPAPSAPKGEN